MVLELSGLEASLTKKQKTIARARKKTEEKLTKEKQAKIDNIQAEYEQKRQEHQEKLEQAKQEAIEDFSRQGAYNLHQDLTQSYELMQSRSELSELTPEQRQRVETARNMLEITTGETLEDRLNTFLQASGNLFSEKEKQILSQTPEDETLDHQTITSYVAVTDHNKKPTCEILVPIDGDDNKKLAETLCDKITDIVGHGRITIVKGKEKLDKTDTVIDSNSETINCTGDFDFVNGFLRFYMTPKKGDVYECARTLVTKLNELQPVGFKETNLTHQAVLLEDHTTSIYNYFVSHTPEEFHSEKDAFDKKIGDKKYLSKDETIELTGKRACDLARMAKSGTLKTNRQGEFSVSSIRSYMFDTTPIETPRTRTSGIEKATEDKRASHQKGITIALRNSTPEELVQRAYETLEEMPEKVSYKDVQEVLYLGNADSSIANLVNTGKLERVRIGKRSYITRASLNKFLETQKPTSLGWRAKK